MLEFLFCPVHGLLRPDNLALATPFLAESWRWAAALLRRAA